MSISRKPSLGLRSVSTTQQHFQFSAHNNIGQLQTGVSKRLSILCSLLLVSLLTGCASQINMLPTLDENNIQSEQGAIVARVINASSYSLPLNQLTISPENLNASSEIKPDRMSAHKNTGLSGTTVFAAQAAPGNYALNSVRAFHSNGDYWYSRFINADAKFGTFSVEAGKITDLGTLIYYQRPEEDRYYNTLIRLPNSDSSDIIDQYFSFYRYQAEDINSWDEDDRDTEREDLFASAAQNPTTYSTRYLAPDGTLYFLAKLGVIIKRSSSGDWSLDAVDTNFELLDIAQNQQGDLIVGGTAGKLFLKRAGQDWIDLSLPHNQHIQSLVFNSDRVIDMIIKTDNTLSVRRASLDAITNGNTNKLQWQIINHYDYVNGWKNKSALGNSNTGTQTRQARSIRGFSLLNTNNKHYIKVFTTSLNNGGNIFATGKQLTFRYDPADWQITSDNEKLEISTIIDAGAIKLGIKKAGFWSWDGKTSYYRHNGKTDSWEKISTHVYRCNKKVTTNSHCDSNGLAARKANFNLSAIPWFKNDLEGLAVVNFTETNIWTAERKTSTKLLWTMDGGKSWSDTEKSLPKKYCSGVVPEISDRLLISCQGATGDFYESTDLAETWEHVRQHESF